jgi:ribonuclease-3
MELYQTAFVHKSYCMNNDYKQYEQPSNCIHLFHKSYERMEFLGDAQLGAVIVSYLYERYPGENEGFMSKMKTKLVNGIRLSEFSTFLGLSEYIVISKHLEENCNGRMNKNILEDVFEGLCGAIYLDNSNVNFDKSEYNNGFSKIYEFLTLLIEVSIDFTELVLTDTNYKDTIMKYLHHNNNYHPKYNMIKYDEINKIYETSICDKDNKEITKGYGNSKKNSEQNASFNALKKFGVL